ncbi:MAG: hypothetical protein ACFBZ8_06505 [Opitutales bacterium]
MSKATAILKTPPGIALVVLLLLAVVGGVGYLVLKPVYDESSFYRMLEQAVQAGERAKNSLETFKELSEQADTQRGETPPEAVMTARDTLISDYQNAISKFDATIRRHTRAEAVEAAIAFTESIEFVENLPGLEQRNRVAYLEELVKLRPQDVSANVALLEARVQRVSDLRQNRAKPDALEEAVSKARENAATIETLAADSAEYHLAVADLEVASGRPDIDRVTRSLGRARELGSDAPGLQLRYAGTLLNSPNASDRNQGEEALRALLDNSDDAERARLVLLEYYLERDRESRALEMAQAILDDAASSQVSRIQALLAYEAIDRLRFNEWLPRLQTAYADDPEAVAALSRPLLERKYAWLLKDWLAELSGRHADNLSFQLVYTASLVELKDWDELQATIVAQDWGYFDYRRRALLARVSEEQGQSAQAQTHWDQALEAAGRSRERLDSLGLLAEQWGWEDKALQVARHSYRADPTQEAMGKVLLQTYLNAGQTVQAIGLLEQMLEQDPENTKLLNDVAYLYLLTDREQADALNYANRCLNQNPDDPNFRLTEAFALYRNGQVEAALKRVQSFSPEEQGDPTRPARRIVFGYILANAGQYAQADFLLPTSMRGLALLPEERTLLTRARGIVSRGLKEAADSTTASEPGAISATAR